MNSMMPLLAVALLLWAGVFGFTVMLDRKVRRLEQQEDRS